MKRNEKGFTLIEILIVLVVLAALAGLAIPGYISTVEKSRRQEALAGLIATKDSLQRFYALASAYPTIGGGSAGSVANFSQLDFDPNAPTAAGTTRHFNYAIWSAATTFTVTATRNSTDFLGFGVAPYATTVNQAGTVTTADTGATAAPALA